MKKTATRRQVLSGIAGAVAGAGLSGRQDTAFAANTPVRDATAWDFVVIGAGVFGSWTAWHLQRQGKKVLLLDAWGPAHSRASSGGESRLIRSYYGTDELFTRMAWESLPEWRALSARLSQPIFHETGAVFLYPGESAETIQAVALHRKLEIPVTVLSKAELASHYPQISLEGVGLGILQPTMGALMARRSVQSLVAELVKNGGEFRQWAIQPPTGASLDKLVSTSGESVHADQYIFACGPWLPKLFPQVIGDRIVPTRQDVFFFAPEAGDTRFEKEHLPAWVDSGDPALHYGFPVLEARGFKIAVDQHGPRVDPDVGDRQVTAEARVSIREYLARRFPALAKRPLVEARVCQYENSASGDFIIDQHPAWKNVWLVGGGSGHGFKHGPAVGRHTAALVTGRLRNPEPRFALAKHVPHDGKG